ncbi:MAG: hypothetical protein PHO66_08080, partial [Eubacteriales bacterium]|nr:hypothetical protein [Eubacteriales bacterium]
MSHPLIDAFHLLDWSSIDGQRDEPPASAGTYGRLVNWARQARGRNPGAFDALTQWILDDSQWSDAKLAENEQILMHGVFARFKEQNARLRACLQALEASGVVNTPVFGALDSFDDELSGLSRDGGLRQTVAAVFDDFSAMRERGVREKIAGSKTGPTGTDSVDRFGYINYLKECDAQVQWALFMPDMVRAQQKDFRVDSFTYKRMPALRFIGREDEGRGDLEARRRIFCALDALDGWKSGFDYDLLLMHHYGLGVDVGPWHGFWGRF